MGGGVRYTIVALVGEGGFGKVYRARMRGIDAFEKDVAIKILTDDHPPRSLLQRFRDEARILGRLRDRAIVGAQNPVRLGGHWSVVMDYVDGESVGALVGRGPVPAGVAVEIVGEVARALDNAWRQEGPDGRPFELIHRDIKPDNLQITPAGEVKLLDFGIAKATFAERETKTKQAFAGTPGYIAPERTQGIEVPLGDVYSLGVVLHEIVVGTRPKMPATVALEGGAPRVSREDLEIEDPDALDPGVRETLELAAWMRAYEHEERPTHRQVEEACRALRQRLPAPWLRDWAEASVRTRAALADDERVGGTFSEEEEGGDTQVPRGEPTPVPVAALAPPVGPPGSGRALAGAAAVFGASGVVLAGAGAVLVVALGALAAAGWVTHRAPAPPEVREVEVPVPVPVPAGSDPGPSVPRPPPARPRERVIDTTGGGSAPPEPTPAPPGVPVAPAAPRPTGRLLLATIPSRPTVRLHGEVVPGQGGTWLLPIGVQTLEIESTEHERVPLVVEIREDRPLSVCYDFVTDQRCAGP